MLKFIKKSFSIVVLCFLSNCATATKEVAQLNLQYISEFKPEPKNNKVIALVSPEGLKAANLGEAKSSLFNQYLSQAQATNFGIYDVDKLRTAIDNGFQEILNKKGFNLIGPYNTFDDLAYGEKKKVYLAVVPTVNLAIDGKITESKISLSNIHTERGVIFIGGEMLINLVEPLTKERLLSKRINLSDFNIKRDYIKQTKEASGNIVIGLAASAFDSELKDNYDKAKAEVLNEFYAAAMKKIDTMLSSEEILSQNKSVEELKEKKRF